MFLKACFIGIEQVLANYVLAAIDSINPYFNYLLFIDKPPLDVAQRHIPQKNEKDTIR